MTCLADWAAMRPKSIGGSGSAMKSPSCGVRDCGSRAEVSAIWRRIVLDRLDDFEQALQLHLAGLGVDLGADVGLGAVAGARRLLDRVLHRGDARSAVDRLFARDRIGDLQQFEPVGTDCHLSSP